MGEREERDERGEMWGKGEEIGDRREKREKYIEGGEEVEQKHKKFNQKNF